MQVTQDRLNLVIRRINLWMGEHGLQLAIPKTEIELLTRRKFPTDINVMNVSTMVEILTESEPKHRLTT